MSPEDNENFWEYRDNPTASAPAADVASTDEGINDNGLAAGAVSGETNLTDEVDAAPATPDTPAPVAPAAVTPVAPPTTITPEQAKIADDLIRQLDGETVLKVKGREYKVSDLSKEELIKYVQVGLRPNQIYEELAAQRREIQQKEAELSRNAEQVQRLMFQYGQSGQNQTQTPGLGQISPDILKPTEYDDENTRSLKQVSAALLNEVNALKAQSTQSMINDQGNQLLSAVDALVADYPMLSKEEVIAVKAMYPQADLAHIAEISHKHYSSKEHLDQLMKVNPEMKRELYEEAVKEYLAKKQSAAALPGKRVAATVGRPAGGPPPRPKTFEEADRQARAKLQELMGSAAEL